MKTINRFSIIMAVLLLSFSSSSCRKNLEPIGPDFTKSGHIITLNVDTKRITKKNMDKTCSFGQTDGSSNENFTITVKPGDSIIWKGYSTWSKDDIVNITKIKYKKGTHIFKRDSLIGVGRVKEKVKGKVRDSVESGSIYEYKIFFTVIHNGKKRNGTFIIDPKIQVDK